MDLAGRLHARLHEKHSQQQGRFKEFCWVWNVMRAMGVCLVCVVCAVVHAYKDSIQGERNSREGTSYFSFCSALPPPFLTSSLSLTHHVNNSETKRAERNFDHWNLSLMGTVCLSAIKWRMINALLYKAIDKEWSSSWTSFEAKGSGFKLPLAGSKLT